MISDDFEVLDAEAVVKQANLNEDKSFAATESEDSETSEEEAKDLHDQVEFISNKYIVIEKMLKT